MGSPKNVLPRVELGAIATPKKSRMSSRRQRRLSRSERWHARRLDHLADRVERRRARLAVRWDKIARQRNRGGLAIRIRHRWFLFTERVEPVVELLLIRWYRFVFRVAAHWERPVMTAGLSVALAVAVIALLPLGVTAPSPSDTSRTLRSPAAVPPTGPTAEPETSPSPEPSSSLSTYTDGLAGYLFTYPGDWDVSTSGTATILSDPEGQIEISFDAAPTGSLQQASDQVLQQLSTAYGPPRTIAAKVSRTSQGYRSIAVGGIANDSTGAQIRFLAITIRGPDENRALLVRFPSDTGPSDLDALLGVVDSFRITRPA